MPILTFTASTTPSAWMRAPLSGEGSLAVTASVIADGLKVQASANADGSNPVDLTDVEVTASPGSVNFKTDLPYIRVAPISGAVTAEEVFVSGLEM